MGRAEPTIQAHVNAAGVVVAIGEVLPGREVPFSIKKNAWSESDVQVPPLNMWIHLHVVQLQDGLMRLQLYRNPQRNGQLMSIALEQNMR